MTRQRHQTLTTISLLALSGLFSLSLGLLGCAGEAETASEIPSGSPTLLPLGDAPLPSSPGNDQTEPPSIGAPVSPTSSVAPGTPTPNGTLAPPVGTDGGPTSTDPPPVDEVTPGAESCAVPRRLRRLSNRRYAKAVRDLLGLEEAPLVTGGGGRLDTLVPGDSRLLSSDLVFEYSQVASEAARVAELSPLLSCDQAFGDRACATEFISSFGLRAFRRPVTADEVERLLTVYDAGAEAGFEAGIRLVLRTLLQTPSFLYQGSLADADATGAVELTPYDIAEILGSMFFDSVPDSELLAAAERGALSTSEDIAEQVERLVALPSVRAQLGWVLDGWFGGTGVLGRAKDPELFPTYDAELSQSLWQSKNRFIEQLLWETQGGLPELFTSNQIWVDARLAAFLGLPAPSSAEWELVNAPANERAGILTHPALMAQLASTDETSVVHRGLFLYNVVLCLPMAAPPEGAVEEGLAVAAQLEDERQRAAYRAEQPTCGVCHTMFDPYGLVFERYDAAGRYVVDADASGGVSLPASIAGEYTDATELMTRLATAPELAACASRQLVSYALEAVAGRAEDCVVQQVHERFASSRGTLVDLFRSLAAAPAMYQRTESSQ